MSGPVDQFVVKPLFEGSRIIVSGMDFSFTNSALWMVIGAIVSTMFLTIATGRHAMVPGRLQMMAELLYEFVGKMVNENIGSEGRRYFPFVFTIFVFVLMGNVLGLLPYSFTYTSHLIVTGALALMIFFAVIIFGLKNHGTHFFSLFLPPGVPMVLVPLILPIELISFFVRPMTLSVRLFANMMAGHIVLKVVASFGVMAATAGGAYLLVAVFPILVNAIMMIFECLVAFIQAYVFALLACVYLKDSVELHH